MSTADLLVRLAAPPADVAPGAPGVVAVQVTNLADGPQSFAIAVAGIEPDWVRLAPTVGPVPAGGTVTVPVTITVPIGYPPARLVAAVTATPQGAPGTSPGRAATADLVVAVGDGSLISAHLEPAEVHGAYGGRTDVVLLNRGSDVVRVELAAETPTPSVQIRFARRDALLHPGSHVRVRARIRAPRPVSGGTQRRPYGVRVQGRTTPIVLEGSLVQRPLLAPGLLKLVALGTVVALWAAVAVVGISALSHRVHKDAAAKAVAAAPPAAAPGGPSAGASGSSGAASGGSAAGGSAGGTSSGRAGGGGFAKPGAAGTDRVTGKVTGPQDPGGVDVQIAPTTLADGNTAGATMLASAVRGDGPGMVWGSVVQAADNAGLTAAGAPTLQVTTSPDGSWSFAGLRSPGTYLVTFSKEGYDTAKYIVTTQAGGQTVSLDAVLQVGTGTISGLVSGPAGALGDVSVTVTDGPVTVTTSTPSSGSGVGTWSIGGLSTPGTYLISASLPNYGTETTTVTLGPSGSAGGVRLTLQPGVASITGTVRSTSQPGVAGLTVTAANAATTLSTTTLSAAGLAGRYTLPNLPIPGTYTLTVSGPGYTTESQTVVLSSNRVISPTVVASSADVRGTVDTRELIPPHTDQCPGTEPSSPLTGLGDAGVSLTDGTTTYKTLTESGGSAGDFDFGQIPAGSYVLSASLYCYTTATSYITVAPPPPSDKRAQVPDHQLLLSLAKAQTVNNATITGSVVGEFTASLLVGVPVELDPGQPGQSQLTYTTSGGLYTFTDVAPGEHEISTESDGCAFGSSTAETCDASLDAGGTAAKQQDFVGEAVAVTVGLSGAVPAPTLELPSLDTLSGQVTNPDGVGIQGATVTLTPSNPASESSPAPVESVAGGGYSIASLVPGAYTLSVKAPDYEPAPDRTVTLLLGQDFLAGGTQLDLAPAVTIAALSGGTAAKGACVLLYDGSGSIPIAAVTATAATPSPLGTGSSIPAGSAFITGLSASSSYQAYVFQLAGTATTSACTSAAAPPTATGPGTFPPTGATDIGDVSFTGTTNPLSPVAVQLTGVTEALDVTVDYRFVDPSGSLGSCPLQATGAAATDCLDVGSQLPTLTLSATNADGDAVAATAVPPTSGAVWTFSQSALTNLHLGGSDTATLTVGGPGFSNPAETVTLEQSNGGSATEPLSLTLTPDASPVSACVTGNGSTPVTVGVSPASVTDPGQTAAVSVGVTSSACPDGPGSRLTWTDSSETGGAAGEGQPGTYSLTASGTGLYSTSTTTVVVGQCASSSSADPTLCPGQTGPTAIVSASQEETLVVSGTGLPAGVDAEAYLIYQPSGTGATVAESGNGGAVAGVEQDLSGNDVTSPSDAQGVPIDSDHQVQFTYLDERNTGGDYIVVISAPGYQTYFSPPILVSYTSSTPANQRVTPGTSVLTPGLTPQETISGTVSGTLLSTTTLSAATVSAAVAAGGNCTVPPNLPAAAGGGSNTFDTSSPTPPATTSGPGGSYTLSGNSTITVGPDGVLSGNTNGGLCSGDSYKVTASEDTYVTGSVQASVGSTGADLTLSPQLVSQDMEVTAGGGQFPAGATVTLGVGPVGGSSSQQLTCSTTDTSPVTETGVTTDPETCTVVPEPPPSGSTGGYEMVTFQLTNLLPVEYGFTLSATDCQTEQGTWSLAYAVNQPGYAGSVLDEALTVDQFEIGVTATADAGSGKGVAVTGLGLVLTDDSDNVQLSGTTGPGGTYGFNDLTSGTYTLSLASGTGYTIASGTTSFTTSGSYAISAPITVVATTPTVDVTVSSSISGAADLAGADVTLTPAPAPAGSLPATCTSQTGSSPLLVAGLAPSAGYSGAATLDGSGDYVASFSGEVVPDFYTVTVGPGTGASAVIPAQSASSTIAICPAGTAELSSTVEQTELGGKVDVPPILGVNPTPAPTVKVNGAAVTLTGPSADGGDDAFSWTQYLPAGTTDADVVTTGPTGYSSDSQAVPLTTSSEASYAATLSLEDTTVPILVQDAGDTPLSGITVTATGGPAGSATPSNTTGTAGIADLSLLPDEDGTNEYTVTASYTTSDGIAVTGKVSFTVDPEPSGTKAAEQTVTVPAGVYGLRATLTPITGSSFPATMTIQFCTTSNCQGSPSDTASDVTVTSSVDATTGVATFDGEVPSADTHLVLSATGYADTTANDLSFPSTGNTYTLSAS